MNEPLGRVNLKIALIDLEAAREQWRLAYLARSPELDIESLETRLEDRSDKVLELMQELIAEQINGAPAIFTR